MTGTERRGLAVLVDKARREKIRNDPRINKHEYPVLVGPISTFHQERPARSCLVCSAPCRGQTCYDCKGTAKRGSCIVCGADAPRRYLCTNHINRCVDCKKPNSPGRARCRACSYTALRSPDRTCVECGKTPIGRKSTRCIKCHSVYMRSAKDGKLYLGRKSARDSGRPPTILLGIQGKHAHVHHIPKGREFA